MARFEPIPDPGGSLDPPRRLPPTALREALALARFSALPRRLNALRPLGLMQSLAHHARAVVERSGRALKRAPRAGT